MYTGDLKNLNKKVLIVYATTSGNAELVAFAVCDGLELKGLKVECKRAELASALEIEKYHATVLISSTWNVGQLNEKMIKFNKELSKLKYPQKVVEVIGIGDSKNYDIFCGAADILEETVKVIEAKQLMRTLRVDGAVFNQLEDLKLWGSELAVKLLN